MRLLPLWARWEGDSEGHAKEGSGETEEEEEDGEGEGRAVPLPHTQQFDPGLFHTDAQFVPGGQSVPALPGPSTLPVHSMPAEKPPLAHHPCDAYIAQPKPPGFLFNQPGVSTQAASEETDSYTIGWVFGMESLGAM